jgi:chromosome segregation ATPase
VPGKTLGDRALELERSTALHEERLENLRQQSDRVPEIELRITTIEERVEALRRDLGRLDTSLGEVVGRIQEINEKRLAFEQIDPASFRDRLKELEVKLDHHGKQRTEEQSRNWAIKLAILSALIGSGFTILTPLLSRYLPGR